MATFPTQGTDPGNLSQGESPSMYECTSEVIDNRSDTDGGYEFRRPRFTRAPRDKVKTGFISLPHVDYLTLKVFWATHTTVVAFNYLDYLHDLTRQVRFEKEPKWDYVGVGHNKMWTCTFEMKEI